MIVRAGTSPSSALQRDSGGNGTSCAPLIKMLILAASCIWRGGDNYKSVSEMKLSEDDTERYNAAAAVISARFQFFKRTRATAARGRKRIPLPHRRGRERVSGQVEGLNLNKARTEYKEAADGDR